MRKPGDEVVEPLSKSNRALGVIAAGLGDARSQALIAAVADAGDNAGATVVVVAVGDAAAETVMVSPAPCDRYDWIGLNRLDGAILTSSLTHPDEKVSDQLATFLACCAKGGRSLPLQAIALDLDNVSSVAGDDYTGMRRAVEHLIEAHGRRRIAFVEGPATSRGAVERYRGYADALAAHGLAVEDVPVVSGGFSRDGGLAAAVALLDHIVVGGDAGVASNGAPASEKVDAIACVDDLSALGVLRALEREGIRVPETVAVVGFGDIPPACVSLPSLTTVRQPTGEIGRVAVARLLAIIEGRQESSVVGAPAELVIRRSCGCPQPGQRRPALGADTVPGALHEPKQPVRFEDHRTSILTALGQVGGETPIVGEIVDALWRDLDDGDRAGHSDDGSAATFLRTVSANLSPRLRKGPDTAVWYAMLSCLGQMIRPLLREKHTWAHAADLLQQARILVDEARLRHIHLRQMEREVSQQRLHAFGAAIADAVGGDPGGRLERLGRLMAASFPGLDVRQCYLSVLKIEETSYAELLVSYRSGNAVVHTEPLRFPLADLAPDAVWSSLIESGGEGDHAIDGGSVVVVLPVRSGDRLLGTALFEGPVDRLADYAWIARYLSSAVSRMRAAEAEVDPATDAVSAADEVAQHAVGDPAEPAQTDPAADAVAGPLVAQRRDIDGAWQAYSAAALGYRWTEGSGASAQDAWLPVMSDAVREARLVIVQDEDGNQTLGLPLKLMDDQIIGALGFASEAKGQWTSDQLVQVVTIAHELAQVLETQRLLSEIGRRASRLAAAAEVSTATTSLTDLDQLLTTAVNLIRERFRLRYTGIFLVDDSREWAVLVAGSGAAGREMLARGHRLRVDETSLIGFCVANAEARITVDTARDKVWRPNPLLPNIRSEMALPLVSRAEVVGAMTIQDERPGAFREEDVTALQTMADQLANAIQNARLIALLEENLREVQIATGQYTESAWRKYAEVRTGSLGYRHRLLGTTAVEDRRPEAEASLRRGAVVLESLDSAQEQAFSSDEAAATGPAADAVAEAEEGQVHRSEGAGADTVATADTAATVDVVVDRARTGLGVPIRLRNQTLGVVNLRFDADFVPPETIQLVQQVADRLAVSLETARLLEESRRTAQREHRIGELSRRIRRSLIVDDVLRDAAREIRSAMDLHSVSVRLSPQGDSSTTPDAADNSSESADADRTAPSTQSPAGGS